MRSHTDTIFSTDGNSFPFWLILLIGWLPQYLPAAGADASLGQRIAEVRHSDDLPGIRNRGVLRILVAYSRTDSFSATSARPWDYR